jgi:hypothetical protein
VIYYCCAQLLSSPASPSTRKYTQTHIHTHTILDIDVRSLSDHSPHKLIIASPQALYDRNHPHRILKMDYILDNVGEWKDRLVNNSIKSFEEMTAQRWVRIIAIVGAYLLIRPYLLNAAAKKQKQQLEKEAEDLGLGKSEALDANDFRGSGVRVKKGEAKKKE